MNNIKTINLLCFIYYMATVHLMDTLIQGTDELKMDTSDKNEIEKWSNSLKPVEVLDWRRLFPNLSGYYYRDYLKKVLALTRCPTHIVNDLAEKYTESNWPSGISNRRVRFYNMNDRENYNCRRLPSNTISKEIIVVLASDNKTMPENMIDDLGFVIFFGKGGTEDKEGIAIEITTDTLQILELDELKKDTSETYEIEKWSNSLKPIKVVDWDRLYSNLSGYYYKDYLRKLLAISSCPTDIINDLSDKYTENNWPPGILTYFERTFIKELMDSYYCRRLPGTSISKEVVVVLASDNKTMPEDMIDGLGFVMIFNKGGTRAREDISVEMGTNAPQVNELEIDNLKINKPEIDETVHLMYDVVIEIDTSDLSVIEKWSNSLIPAKVVRWDDLLTSFSSVYTDYIAKILVANGCPIVIVNGLAEKHNLNHWPPGIWRRIDKMSKGLMKSFICRRLPSILVDEEVVIVFASDNKTMPEDMIDEIGFIMLFDKGGIANIDDIAYH